jgi:hypothetical protein
MIHLSPNAIYVTPFSLAATYLDFHLEIANGGNKTTGSNEALFE